MTTVNHECYVSLELAKLLKQAGFDWKCSGIYVLDSENDPEYVFSTANFTNTSKEIEGYMRLSAPTLEVAQRWLREVMKIEVFVEPFIGFYKYVVQELKDDWIYSDGREKSYEEAQEAGIKKALEIILEKRK